MSQTKNAETPKLPIQVVQACLGTLSLAKNHLIRERRNFAIETEKFEEAKARFDGFKKSHDVAVANYAATYDFLRANNEVNALNGQGLRRVDEIQPE